MKKPIIGIIPDYSTKKIKQGGYANFPWYALRSHYSQAITQACGIPILLPYSYKLIRDYLKICKGLIFPGSDIDIHPSLYGEKVSVKKIDLDKNNPRIDFELELIQAALKKNIPILGICAGLQLLNVALGGSLYQDIKEQVQTDIIHMHRSENNAENTHPIIITKGTLLNKIIGKTNYIVTSFHHQAVKKIGKNLKISAIAPDGVVEAIELDNYPFCIGVEWHPEFQETNEDKKLFKAFIAATQKHHQK